MATTTAIDLSRLPAPSFAAPLSFEEIFAAMAGRMVTLMPEFDATIESDPAVKVLEVAAYFVMLERQRANDNALKVMLAYSEDGDLDQIGANFNVGRLVLDPGDPAQGIGPTYESNEAYRERIQLSPESLSVAGPGSAYEFHARSADASIVGAKASSPHPDDIRAIVVGVLTGHGAAPDLVTAMTAALDVATWPGTVVISLLSRFGDGTADDEQIEAVAEVLGNSSGALRPLTDNVVVQSVEIVPYQIEASLTLYEGPDENLILAAAEARLAAYVSRSRAIGRDVTRFGINAALAVEGVSNVNLPHPAADVIISDTQCSNCVGSIVTVAGRGG